MKPHPSIRPFTRRNFLKATGVTAASLLLLVGGILLWPSAQRPATASADPAERARPINRESKTTPRPLTPRRAKDLQIFVKLVAKDQIPKLTRQEIDNYIEAQHRSMDSLLGELMGIAAEKGELKGLDDPESIARLEEIDRQRNSLIEGIHKVDALRENAAVPESDWLL